MRAVRICLLQSKRMNGYKQPSVENFQINPLTYTDIFQSSEDEEKKQFAQRVIDEDLFWPVILVEDNIVGEGSVRLKTIYAELEKYGYKSQ